MKKIRTIILAVGMILGSQAVQAQSLGDILKGLGGSSNNENNTGSGGGIGDMLGNLIDGIFTKTDLSLQDLVGEYVSEGPAVTFKSDNFLQKAGGIAGAAAIESKLAPYYNQYGLTGMTLIIDNDANFTMKIKGIPLKGVITKNEGDGTFDFNFQVVGINLGKFTAYIEKSGKNLDLMFDAKKLVTILSAIVKFTGNQLATTMISIIDSYEGACIGFKMVSTGKNTNTNTNTSTTSSDSSDSNSSNGASNGLDALRNLLNKGK